MRILRALIGSLLLLELSACSSFDEHYHFRARGKDHTNYYRVTISGWTTLSSSQYAAGLYDAEAVNALFGEVKSKEGEPKEEEDDCAAAKEEKIESIDGKSMADRKLVLFLSANSDAFVGQIQSFVNSKEIQESMVTLILKDDVEKLAIAREEVKVEDARAEALEAELKSLAGAVEPSGSIDAKKLQAKLLETVTALARSSSEGYSSLEFKDMQKAQDWFANNPGAFEGGRN